MSNPEQLAALADKLIERYKAIVDAAEDADRRLLGELQLLRKIQADIGEAVEQLRGFHAAIIAGIDPADWWRDGPGEE